MPNGVKYSTTTPSGSLRRGNVALGVNGNLGPTSTTGFYSMPAPQSGKYIINKVSVSGIPNFFAPQNDAELIRLARAEGAVGADTGSAAAVLAWMATQDNLEAVNIEYENIVTDGLIFSVDAGFTPSYPTTGTTWYNLVSTNITTLYNGTSFSTNNGGILVFDGVDDYTVASTNISFTTQGTISFWMLADAVESYRNPLQINGGSIRFEEYSPGDTFHGGFLAWNGADRLRYLPYPETLTQGAWYNVVLTWDTTVGKAVGYLNNSLKFNDTLTGAMPTTISQVHIGFGFDLSRVWKGKISNTFLYNKQLSAAEVSQNYNAQKGRFGL